MSNDTNLGDFELDALREIGNIGAGHAATSLSHVLDRKILIDVPNIKIVPLVKLPEQAADRVEEPVTAVYVRITGDITGTTLFLLSSESARRIASVLLNDGENSIHLSRKGKNLLNRIGGIMVSSYLNALAMFTGLRVVATEPSFAFDMAGALVEAVAIELDLEAEVGIVVETRFVDDDEEVDGRIVFLPTPKSLGSILAKIGVY
ncbi:MAG: chemotaxis protein CheC [Actinobacteria bacterium]|nr:chemotaxis protein CheC [Actinomycetota bacterium]